MEEKKQGLIQVYTGNGKGKSTAAFGLALRASGCEMKTAIVQFMKKGEWYGEIKAFQNIPLIEIYSYGSDKFLRKGTLPDRENLSLAKAAMEKAYELMKDESVDILILDELNNAVFFDLVQESDVISLLQAKPDALEIVVTGRNATEQIIAVADLVTEMREIKHPYEKGIPARKGIEY